MRILVALLACASCGGFDTSTDTSAISHHDNWPMFGHDPTHSFTNDDAGFTRTNAPTLELAWTFPSADLISAQAIVADGTIYIGGWDGYFYAIDQQTGTQRWRFAVDCQNAVVPVPPRCSATPPPRDNSDGGLITSSATVLDNTVYFSAGRTMYALNRNNGHLRWKHVICGNPDDPHCRTDAADSSRIFSSPTIHHGKIFVGITNDGQDGYRGAILAIDRDTGAERWRFEVDPVLDSHGNPIPGRGRNRGCGNVWTTGTVDPDHDLVVFGTADCDAGNDPPYHSAILGLDTDTGHLRWVYAPHATDPGVCDVDFGATANLIGNNKFGVGGKDGTYYVLDHHGHLRWSTNVVFGGSAGGFIGSTAYDGHHIIGATGFGDFTACDPTSPADQPIQESSLHAFDPHTGAVQWEATASHSYAATTISNRVAFSTYPGGLLGEPPAIHINDVATGALLGQLPLPASSNAPTTPVGGMLLVPMGNFDGTGGALAAYTIP